MKTQNTPADWSPLAVVVGYSVVEGTLRRALTGAASTSQILKAIEITRTLATEAIDALEREEFPDDDGCIT